MYKTNHFTEIDELLKFINNPRETKRKGYPINQKDVVSVIYRSERVFEGAPLIHIYELIWWDESAGPISYAG